MKNRGSVAEQALIRSGLAKGLVAEKLHIDRRTLYNRLQRPDLEYDFIIRLYDVLRLDVTEDFPELGKYIENEDVTEAIVEDKVSKAELDSCLDEVDKWKNKYIQLLEEYNQVLKENRDLLEKQRK